MNKTKDIKDILKLLEKFLKDGRSFCFQAQSQCDYFNISLSPQPGAIRRNTQYYHSYTLADMVKKIDLMVAMSGEMGRPLKGCDAIPVDCMCDEDLL